MSGWATLGAALGGANNGARQQMLFNQGAEQGARIENLLGEARRRRDQNLAFQSITPDSIAAAMSTADPITGQPYRPEAAQAMQGNLMSAMLHAGVDLRQLSGYQKGQQDIGWGNQAWSQATSANPDDNLLTRMQIVRAGKPVERARVEGNAVIDPYKTPDSQTVRMTDLGQAMAGAQGALAGKYGAEASAAHALVDERNAHAGLYATQTAAGGWNPHTGDGGGETAAKPTLPSQGAMASVLGQEYDDATGKTTIPKAADFMAWQASRAATDPRYANGNFALQQWALQDQPPTGAVALPKDGDLVTAMGGTPTKASDAIPSSAGAAVKPAAAKPSRTVVRTGTANGRKVVQYDDGSIDYAD